MDNEVPLPPPPRIRHRSPTAKQARQSDASLPSSNSISRSRTSYQFPARFDDRSSQPSSDPAFFSSDDIPASGLENYDNAPSSTAASRKRRYQGTWWGEMVFNLKRKRADFKDKRFVDSGVWMGSDESLRDSPSEDMLWEGQPGSKNEHWPVAAQSRAVFKGIEEPEEHKVARAIVLECLEKGQDSVDLSNSYLRTVPPGLLGPLQHLTKVPIVEPPITEDLYSSLQPFLRLFLSGNALTALSRELFELRTLKVLSLRNNKLSRIPPAIRNLTDLQELNISVNRLQYLPWELLWLIRKGDLRHLVVRPNPLAQMEDTPVALWHYENNGEEGIPLNGNTNDLKLFKYEGPPPEEAWAPIHIATGPVQRFSMEGFPIPSAGTRHSNRNNMSAANQTQSRVPSLREVALLTLSRSPYFDQISDSEIATFPALIARLLWKAREVRNAAGQSCSVCHRSFVVPRAEWIEWWDCSTYENGLKRPRYSGESLRPLPFQRFGCSWACVPSQEEE